MDPANRPASSAEAAHALRGVVGRLRRRLLAVSGSDVLTPAQASALTLFARGDADSGASLAQAERISAQAAAVTVAALAKAGLIERTADPADGRRQIIAVTETGLDYVQGARGMRQAWLEQGLTEEFTEDERAQLIAAAALLERLLQR